MDKKALQYYAVWAKNNLEQQIEISLKSLYQLGKRYKRSP